LHFPPLIGIFTIMLMSASNRAARLYYLPSSYRVLQSGDHVVCALTGQHIPLDGLRYWSADRQEAYASAALAVKAITGREPAPSAAE
jgi:hypothetical protein